MVVRDIKPYCWETIFCCKAPTGRGHELKYPLSVFRSFSYLASAESLLGIDVHQFFDEVDSVLADGAPLRLREPVVAVGDLE